MKAMNYIRNSFKIVEYKYRYLASNLGADPGGEGGAPGARPPKIGKNVIFFFT